jgi:RNA polymerase subunit RPABC4/transcription elongation factor Spt4
MVTCDRCKTVNPPTQKRCQNCQRDLLPGRSAWVRLGVLIVSLALGAFGAFILVKMAQGADLPDLGCAFTSPVYWVIFTIGVPLLGLVYALQRTPAHEKFVDRAKRHLSIDPAQALADLSKALNLAPEKQKTAILKERAKLLAAMDRMTESTRDKIASMEGEGAYEGAGGFAALVGMDKDVYVAGVKSSQQSEMVKSHAAVGLGWCKKCKTVVELDDGMHCKVHPTAKITDIHLAVPEDVPVELNRLIEELTRRNKSLRTKRIVYLILFILVVVALCYLSTR